jgi:hypothetical protein
MRTSLNLSIYFLIIFGSFAGTFLFSEVTNAQAYCVRKAGAKLYSKADERLKPTWRAPLHTPLMGTGNKSNLMVEVTDMSYKKYWINKKNLSGRISCLVVRVKKTNLRTGPGLSYPASKIKYAEKYEAFVDLGGEDGWTQIKDDEGNRAWVNLDQVWKPKNRMRISFEQDK